MTFSAGIVASPGERVKGTVPFLLVIFFSSPPSSLPIPATFLLFSLSRCVADAHALHLGIGAPGSAGGKCRGRRCRGKMAIGSRSSGIVAGKHMRAPWLRATTLESPHSAAAARNASPTYFFFACCATSARLLWAQRCVPCNRSSGARNGGAPRFIARIKCQAVWMYQYIQCWAPCDIKLDAATLCPNILRKCTPMCLVAAEPRV